MLGRGHFGVNFPVKILEQKSQNLTPTFELCRTAAGLSARHRRSSWSVFSILSKNLIGLKRSRLGCILLHCPGKGDEGGKTFHFKSARFKFAEFRVPEPLEESTGGRGSVVVTGPLQEDCHFQVCHFQKSKFLTNMFFTQICLKNASVKLPTHFEHF